jgi:hypothetical protein
MINHENLKSVKLCLSNLFGSASFVPYFSAMLQSRGFESRLSRQCGILNLSQPYRPTRHVTGIALFTYMCLTKFSVHKTPIHFRRSEKSLLHAFIYLVFKLYVVQLKLLLNFIRILFPYMNGHKRLRKRKYVIFL